MPQINYRVHSTDAALLVSELNAQLDAISNRFDAMSNLATNPKGNINMGGGATQANNKITNLAPATDEHDAVTLGQLKTATDLSKKLVAGPGLTIVNGGKGTTTTVSITGGGTPTGAPLAPTYVTQAAETSLPNSRRLAAGTGVTLTDAGAGSTLTVAIGQAVATSSSPTFAGLALTGIETLDNNIAIKFKDSGGTARNGIILNNVNDIHIGGTGIPNVWVDGSMIVTGGFNPAAIGITGAVTDSFTVNGAPLYGELVGFTGISGNWICTMNNPTVAAGLSFGLIIRAGTTAGDNALLVQTASPVTTILNIRGDGTIITALGTVTVGAVDSGGAGFRLLRVPN